MNNWKLDYWIETVESAMEAIGHNLTAEELKLVAETMQQSAEMEGFYSGEDAIPNPLEDKLRDQKRKHENEINEWESRERIYRQSVATRKNIPIEDVYIEGNNVMYDTRHQWR